MIMIIIMYRSIVLVLVGYRAGVDDHKNSRKMSEERGRGTRPRRRAPPRPPPRHPSTNSQQRAQNLLKKQGGAHQFERLPLQHCSYSTTSSTSSTTPPPARTTHHTVRAHCCTRPLLLLSRVVVVVRSCRMVEWYYGYTVQAVVRSYHYAQWYLVTHSKEE